MAQTDVFLAGTQAAYPFTVRPFDTRLLASQISLFGPPAFKLDTR